MGCYVELCIATLTRRSRQHLDGPLKADLVSLTPDKANPASGPNSQRHERAASDPSPRWPLHRPHFHAQGFGQLGLQFVEGRRSVDQQQVGGEVIAIEVGDVKAADAARVGERGAVTGGGGIAHLAHLGGRVGGFLMVRYRRGQLPLGMRRRR